MNNYDALQAAIADDSLSVECRGQTFTLKAPSFAECMDIARRVHAVSKYTNVDDRAIGFITIEVDAVVLCMNHDPNVPIPREDVEKLILLTGIQNSPLVDTAKILVGIENPVDPDEVDADLPFGSPGQQDNH